MDMTEQASGSLTEEEQFIVANHASMSANEMATKLGIAITTVKGKISRLKQRGFIQPLRQRHDWKAIDEYITTNHEKLTEKTLAVNLGIPHATLKLRISKLRAIGALPPAKRRLESAFGEGLQDPGLCKHSHRMCGDAAIVRRWPNYFDKRDHAPEDGELQVCVYCMHVKIVYPEFIQTNTVIVPSKEREFEPVRRGNPEYFRRQIDRELIDDAISASFEPVEALEEEVELGESEEGIGSGLGMEVLEAEAEKEQGEELEEMDLPGQNGHSAVSSLSDEVLFERAADEAENLLRLSSARDLEPVEPTTEDLASIEMELKVEGVAGLEGAEAATEGLNHIAKIIELYETVMLLRQANQTLSNENSFLRRDLSSLEQQLETMKLQMRIVELEAENKVLKLQVSYAGE